MKSLLLLVLIFSVLTGLLPSWQRSKVVATDIAAKSSAVPQFILDTRHPWLQMNMGYLETLEDPKSTLCDLNSSLRPTNQSEDLAYPTNLFKYLEIDNCRAGALRPGWENAIERIGEISSCPAALHDVEEFKVDICVHPASLEDFMNHVRNDPPPDLPNAFVKVLSSMPRLRKLWWNTGENGNGAFEKAFTDANLTLPSVRHLVPAMLTEFMVRMCPEIEHLESTTPYWAWANSRYSTLDEGDDVYMQFVNSSRIARNLMSFTMAGDWKVEHLKSMKQAANLWSSDTCRQVVANRSDSAVEDKSELDDDKN